MLLLSLNLLFLCELLRCDELNSDNTDVSPHTGQEHKGRRNDNNLNHTTTEVLVNGTAESDQTVHISTHHFFLTAPPGNEDNHDPPSSFSPSSPFANRSSVSSSPNLKRELDSRPISSPNSPSAFVHSTASSVKLSTRIPSPTRPIFRAASLSSHNIARSDVSASNHSKSCPTSGTYPASTPPYNFDPSVADIAKKWLHGVTSPAASTPKKLVPKLTLIFDYDVSTHRFPHDIKRNQNTQRKKSNRNLERERSTKPQKSKRRQLDPDTPTFWHDPPEELPLIITKRTPKVTIATKQRLEPGLLLDEVTVSDIKKKDVEEYDNPTSERVQSKMFMRMHRILDVTKKEWYSDRTKKTSKREQTGTVETTTKKHQLRRGTGATTTKKQLQKQLEETTITIPEFTTSASVTPFTLKNENRKETMIVFVTEIMRLIATKQEKAVHDVIKHVDVMFHSIYKSGQFHWVTERLIDFTAQIVKSVKESKTSVIQKQASDLYLLLSQRRDRLSKEVNTALEYADRFYDDNEGEQLMYVMKEFAAFPNITLTGYWMCNILINSFLRPYRHLKDDAHRLRLMQHVDLAVRTSQTPNGSNKNSALRYGGVTQTAVPPDEKVTQKERKRKRRHRSHKMKRGRKRYVHRTRAQKGYTYNKDLMLRTNRPRTRDQPR